LIENEIHFALPRRWSLIRTYPDESSVNHLITSNSNTQRDLLSEIILVIVHARSVSDNSFGEGGTVSVCHQGEEFEACWTPERRRFAPEAARAVTMVAGVRRTGPPDSIHRDMAAPVDGEAA